MARKDVSRDQPGPAGAEVPPALMLAAFEGWNDAGNAASQAIDLLLDAWERAGKADAAERVIRRLGAENAHDPSLLADLGNRALWIERTNAALEMYLAALDREPDNLKALKGSGQIFAWNNDAQRAIRQFERYIRLHPNDYEVRYQLGELYFSGLREGDAFRQYRQALSLIDEARRRTGAAVRP